MKRQTAQRPQPSIDSLSALLQHQAQACRALIEAPDDQLGQILWGANNIFLVACQDGSQRKCRLRGKTLKHPGVEREHNPLICGDLVLLEIGNLAQGPQQNEGLIYRRLERRNVLQRRNIKRGEPQSLAANIDGVVLLASWSEPPLRRAFLDRLLIAAQCGDNSIILLLNKIDCVQSFGELKRLQLFLKEYRKIGLEIWPISVRLLHKKNMVKNSAANAPRAKHMPGEAPTQSYWQRIQRHLAQIWIRRRYLKPAQRRLMQLYQSLQNRLYVILGASGVGKSSLCNYLFPEQWQETRSISRKWQRGVHTTTLARTIMHYHGTQCYRLIDTPGMRNFLPEIIPNELSQLQNYYPEFASLRKICSYSSCQHHSEPDCAVRDAAECGLIPLARYNSYLKLYSDLEASFAEKQEYQIQSKGKNTAASKKSEKNTDDSRLNAPPNKNKSKNKGQGRRGDHSQGRDKERKQKRRKLQFDREGNWD